MEEGNERNTGSPSIRPKKNTGTGTQSRSRIRGGVRYDSKTHVAAAGVRAGGYRYVRLYIDQAGNEFPGATPPFISPEWGEVTPFALSEADLTIRKRDGFRYRVYHDPGPPPYLDPGGRYRHSAAYQWGFVLVSIWSSHLDPADGVLWDISPAAIGNVPQLPRSMEAYPAFYDLFEGGDPGQGHELNPHTGQPYSPQWVPRADYARVLAEFWADGPDSETPPGHWFAILNYVNDHPALVRRFRGHGPVLDDLEWDVKAYFALGGAVHDAAIAAWGVKGWYDYIRPISAIRGMAERGQSSDPELPRYAPDGIPLGGGLRRTGSGGRCTGRRAGRARRQGEAVRLARTGRHRATGIGRGGGGLDSGRELVALPEAVIRLAAVRRLRVGPLDLLPRRRRSVDPG